MLKFLTIVGAAKKSNGIFLPNLLVMNPKIILPINPPMQEIDAIHDASVIEIFPVGNGDSSDVRIKILGLAYPKTNSLLFSIFVLISIKFYPSTRYTVSNG